MTTDAVSAATNTTTGAATLPAKQDNLLADKDTFLKLLVAQLSHQNPLDPADGLQFVTQLAQFTQLEHTATMREDLDAIRAALESQAAQQSATTGQTQKTDGQ